MIGLVVILGLVAMNGLFVAIEFVIVGARLSRVETLSNRGRAIAARLEGAVAQDRYVAVAQLGVTLASIGLGMYGEHKIAQWIEEPLAGLGIDGALVHVIALVLAVAILTYLHVVFGEMIPKAMALQDAEKLLIFLWPIIRLFDSVFRPMVMLLNAISRALLGVFGLDAAAQRHYTPRELADIAETSEEGGSIGAEQLAFIQNIVRLQGRRADELMRPRRDILVLDLSSVAEESLTETILGAGPSRLPVVDGGFGTVLGLVHVKDVIRYSVESGAPLDRAALEAVLRPLPKVPAAIDSRALLDGMRRRGAHMALVMDEFGSIIGAVTFEDAIEEIVGELRDEFEVDATQIERVDGHRWRVPGEAQLTRLRERCGWTLDTRQARTIAGYMIESLRRAPREGDSVEAEGLRLIATAMKGLAITEVTVEKIGEDEANRENPTEALGEDAAEAQAGLRQ